MRRTLYNLLAVVILLSGVAGHCKKKSSGGGTNEAPLNVTLNPPADQTQPPVAQTTFPLTVTITSAMPSGGVTIAVSAAKESTPATTYFTDSKNTTSATSNFTILNTPVGDICVTTVTVTSNSTPSNKWTGSYRYSRKS